MTNNFLLLNSDKTEILLIGPSMFLYVCIVCYLLNMVLFYLKYDQECDPQTDQYVEVFQSIRQY